jgi:Domain of unknown function (DUF4159)/Aerotolerance regulator N-terminal
MHWLSSIGFVTPAALWGLLALPLIWWLLQFTPPRPQTLKFPPLRILLNLQSREETPDKTPWWLLALRLLLAAVLIVAVAHPQLRKNNAGAQASGPLLLIVDDGWAAAKSWDKRQQVLKGFIEQAREQNRIVSIATSSPTAETRDIKQMSAGDALSLVAALRPQALGTDRLKLLHQLRSQKINAGNVTWLSDGIDAGSGKTFFEGLTQNYGPNIAVFTLGEGELPIALAKPVIDNGDIAIAALRTTSANSTAKVQATANNGRVLAELPLNFGSSTSVQVKFNLPVELRNEIQSISIVNENHAGARQLLDDRWRRKTIAIETGAALETAQPLLSPLHYVTNALQPYADLREPQTSGQLNDELAAGLSMLVMADIGKIPQDSHDVIMPWIEKGGILLRFAGPRVASSSDDLLPVKLRDGDRNLGSALSWETPQTMQTFSDKSPFSGIKIDERVTIARQILAEPEADLAEKTWASLNDGTPLVTARKQGKGLIILFHITANADWSNLPLSGTFVEMLQRIVELAPAAGSNTSAAATSVTGTDFTPKLLLSGTGDLVSPTTNVPPIVSAQFDLAQASAKTPAGIYANGSQERAINLDLKAADLAPIAGISQQQIKPAEVINYAPQLFSTAAALFLLDCLAALFLGGALRKGLQNATALIFVTVCSAAMLHASYPAWADDQSDMQAALETHLAFVKTGEPEIDANSLEGLKGLGLIMADRTSAALGEPVGIDIETDNLAFYPLLYWPVTEQAQAPADATLRRLDSYMKNGGTIFFDLRDNGGDFASSSGTSDALKRILAKLDIPPLEPVPESHVLTRSFYLLKSFPGRYEGGPLWVETQSADTTGNSSDGVSGIIIGSNDYAAAWALDRDGNPLNAVIPGSDRQRETAFRVGVNIVMYALTGNYKTDQVHVPALLERLGQ